MSNFDAMIAETRTTPQVMRLVCLALIPGALIQIHYLGWGVLVNLLLCSLTAVITEAAIIKLRNKPVMLTISDHSALLTGLLIAIAIPPLLPWWMSIIGVSFAIIIAKQLYGGLGFNPFNPAMVGYVLLLISFPVEMTSWLPSTGQTENIPNLIESWQIIFFGQTSAGQELIHFRTLADGFTMATPLDLSKTSLSSGNMITEISSLAYFIDGQSDWFWINFGYLIGGIFLLASRVIRWHIPVSFLLSVATLSMLLHTIDDQSYLPATDHLMLGATMLGAFFIATDPVSAATTPKGRLIYGSLIGLLVVVIRNYGGYPEAVAFAVLLLNIASPTIDHYTKPSIYGERIKVTMDD